MDRLSQLRGGAGGSRDSSLDGSAAGDSFLTANDTPSKYYSLSEDDSSFDITKDVSLAPSTSEATLNDSDCFSNLSPIGKKDLLDYKFGKQIEAANILSGGVNIFDDNENSYDGDELVIDDNVEIGESSSTLKSPEDAVLPVQEDVVEAAKPTVDLPGSSALQRDIVETRSQSPKLDSADLPMPDENDEAIVRSPSMESLDSADLQLDKDEDMVENSQGPSGNALSGAEQVAENADNMQADDVPNGELPENGDMPLPDEQLPENGNLPLEQAAEHRHLPIDNGELQPGNLVEEVNENRPEVVLQIDGNNVAAINIGTGLYLYRKEGEEELAAVQIAVDDVEPSFKFLKVRENDEGNLEVYEEIQEVIVVPQEAPVRVQRPVLQAAPSTSREEPKKDDSQPSTSRQQEDKVNTPEKDAPVASTSRQDNEVNKEAGPSEPKPELNLNGKPVKFSEARKSPLMAYHSTPNKEGIPLTKTMVDQQLHPNRHSDNIKKTIEVHTDSSKQKNTETPSKSKDAASSDKVPDEEPQVDKPIDKEDADKSNSTVTKENVVEVVEERTEEVASCSNIKLSHKVEDEKLNVNEVNTLVINELKESTDKVSTVSEEENKKIVKKSESSNEPSRADSAITISDINTESKVVDKEAVCETTMKEDVKDKETPTTSSSVEVPMKTENQEVKLPRKEEVKEVKIPEKKQSKEVKQPENEQPKEAKLPEKEQSQEEKLPEKEQSKEEKLPEKEQPKEVKLPEKEPAKDMKLPEKEPAKEVKLPDKEQPKKEKLPGKEQVKEINLPEKEQPKQVKLPEKELSKEKPLDTPTEIIELDDMEIDEDALVIEEQIVDSQPDVKESAKQNESVVPFAQSQTKIIDKLEHKIYVKPTILNESKLSIVKTLDSNKPSKIDNTTTVAAAHSINLIQKEAPIIANKAKIETKSQVSSSKKEIVTPKNTQLSNNIKILENRVVKESTLVKGKLDQNREQSVSGASIRIKTASIGPTVPIPVANVSTIPVPKVDDPASLVQKVNYAAIAVPKINNFVNNLINKHEKVTPTSESTDKDKKPEPKDKTSDKKDELPTVSTKDVKSSSLPVKDQRHTNLPKIQNAMKPVIINKSDIKLAVVNSVDTKKDVNHKPIAVDSKPKSINNNHAPVPFGKWTEANRQDFLNKIKESKPVTVANTNQIKQPKDLNRRDVLKKIDSQRQTYNANVKIQESLQKGNVKNEATFASKSATSTVTKQETKVPVKPEVSVSRPKILLNKKPVQAPVAQPPAEPAVMAATVSSSTNDTRKEINNQDLIDKTIEGIINRAVAGKSPEDAKQVVAEKPTEKLEKLEKKPEQKTNSQPTLLDAIEMKMNELHGIPFVERPPHELPRPYLTETRVSPKTEIQNLSQKTSKIPNLLPLSKSQQKLKDCEDDIIIVETSRDKPVAQPFVTTKPSEKPLTIVDPANTSKDKIITEKEFDRFARRNSVTYENCLTVTDSHQVIQTVVPKETPPKKISRNEQMLAEAKAKSPHKHLPVKQYHPSKAAAKYIPVGDQNKQYQSKLQIAYHTAMTAKRRMDSPITIIEDKPVKVVYLDTNVSEFTTAQLNVQGRDLSPAKRASEPDAVTVGTGDSLDSDLLDAMDDSRSQEETKTKSKHQRKQVLTPVETPDLELIEPGDLGIEVSPRKKRRVDERSAKSLVPKKSYLLGRNVPPVDPSLPKETLNPAPPVVRNDAVSAIDNLVKAAELLENQSGSMDASSASVQSVDSPQGTPVKRGRGRPRKNPLPDAVDVKGSSPPKKPRLIDAKAAKRISTSEDDSSDDDSMIKENWTMGKINEKIVCPICNKLFRSENVVFKHVKHCTGPSPSRSDSDKRSPLRSRLSRESETKSRDSEPKSRGSRYEDDDVDLAPARKTPIKRKSKDSGKSSSSDEVIPIETEPKASDSDVAKKDLRKSVKPKLDPRTNNLVCEICGKSFRQLSYLVSHKQQHKKEENKRPANETQSTDRSVFGCETCKKEFRKLHHLVQHRLIHNPVQSRASRKTSSEQKELPKNQESSKVDDQSAGFRCEPCDKSFRKLHHLVEHRETHDGINRQRSNSITQVPDNKDKPTPPPQCDICKKTFRKLHHLIEHKEQHLETSSEKSDDQKSVKSSLSTKDIIHECNMCYMVFPNEHSLTKHTVICLRKKKQSAAKQAAAQEEKSAEDAAKAELPDDNKVETVEQPIDADEEKKSEKIPEKSPDPPTEVEVPKIKEDPPKAEAPIDKVEKQASEPKPVVEKKTPVPEKAIPKIKPEPAKLKQIDEIIVIEDTPKKKVPAKDKVAPSVTKRSKDTPPVEVAPPTSSDDDEVRYMLNPDFKEDTIETKNFIKVRAKKRNSLQIERPGSKDLVRRRSLLQHPPKIPRLRAKSDDAPVTTQKPVIKPKVEKPEVLSTDSDDSDVKYSFPVPEKPETVKQEPVVEKTRRKTMAEKRKSLSGIAKRKSLGKAIVKTTAAKPAAPAPIKRRTMAAEHRCDCGQLFSSAALLARHAILAHTPPRVRRRRDTAEPAPETKPDPKPVRKSNVEKPARKSSARSDASVEKPTRKSSARSDASVEKPTRKSSVNSTRKAPETVKKTLKSRNRVHGGVPLPEKRATRK